MAKINRLNSGQSPPAIFFAAITLSQHGRDQFPSAEERPQPGVCEIELAVVALRIAAIGQYPADDDALLLEERQHAALSISIAVIGVLLS